MIPIGGYFAILLSLLIAILLILLIAILLILLVAILLIAILLILLILLWTLTLQGDSMKVFIWKIKVIP
jgi:hypothetical protein